jgi:hypothetical protein
MSEKKKQFLEILLNFGTLFPFGALTIILSINSIIHPILMISILCKRSLLMNKPMK